MTSKELRQERATVIVQARADFDKTPNPTAEQNAAFDAAMARADEMLAQAERLERGALLAASLAERAGVAAVQTGLSIDETCYNRESEKRVLTALLRGHTNGLSDAERAIVAQRRAGYQAAASTSTSTAGGYLIAPEYQHDLLIAMKAQGGMRSVATVIETATGVTLPWPTMDDRAQVATIISENTQVNPDTDLTFGSVTMGGYTYKSGVLLVSLQMLQDSAFDFDKLIRDAMAGRFVRGQNAHFTTGTGVGQPQGLLTAAPVGITGNPGSTLTATFDNMIDLIHSVDPVYRPGAEFMFHDTTLQMIRKIKDAEGRYLWQPFNNGVAGAPLQDSIWGYGTVINQDMPVLAANATPIVFGNLSTYIVRDILGMQMMVLRERYADFLQVGYIGYMRSDGRLVTAAAPVKSYKNSAT